MLSRVAAGLVLTLAAACGSTQVPPAPAPPTSEPQATSVLFGQTFTWPDGTSLVVLPPEPEPAHAGRIALRLRATAGATGLDPTTDLQLTLTAHGQPLTVQNAPSTGLPDVALQPGRSQAATLVFAPPPTAGDWQCTATRRGSPLVVTYSPDI
jgi:hypothetical protein